MKGGNLVLLALFLATCFFSAPVVGQRKNKPRPHKHKRSQRSSRHTGFVGFDNADSPEFQRFIQGIRQLKFGKPGKSEMLILGDSHMQCEDFGNALATYFQDSLGVPLAGRGFVFPYPLARTSHRSNMTFSPCNEWAGCRITRESNRCDWGLSGWVATLNRDSTSFSWTHSGAGFRKGDRINLLVPDRQSAYFSVFMSDTAGGREPLVYNRNQAGFCGQVGNSSNRLRFDILRNRPGEEFTLQGMVVDPASHGLVVGISGTNGARLDHYLQSPDLGKHLRVLAPDLVVICLGTNDAFVRHFDPSVTRDALQKLLEKIKSALPDAAVLLVGPPDHCLNRKRVNPATRKVNTIFAEIADNLDFVYWNQQKAMGGQGSIHSWRRRKLATKDLVHFTPDGYAKQARLLGRAFSKTF